MRGRNSSIVTSEPSRFQTEPSSRPIAPAPITISFFGGSVNSSASVLLTIVLPSNFANGSSTGALPVAMTIFFVSTSCVSPLDDLIETFPGALIVPRPSNTVTLFVFISERTPLLNVFTTLFFALLHLREIGARAVDNDAVLRRLFFDEHEVIARSEKRFARDAAHIRDRCRPVPCPFRQGRSSTQAGRSEWQQHNRPALTQ